jgi:hypothetical protein
MLLPNSREILSRISAPDLSPQRIAAALGFAGVVPAYLAAALTITKVTYRSARWDSVFSVFLASVIHS